MTNKENMSIYKNLTMLSTAKFLSGFAGYVYDVGIVIYLYNMTESVAVIGGFFVSQFLPAFVMLMLGEMIDRYNKKRLMIISGFIKAVICLVLLNNRSVWSIYLTTFLMNLILEFIKFIIFSLGIVTISKYMLVPVLRKISVALKLSPKASGNIAGFATSVPEFLTVSFSAASGLIGTSVYNILSSNIINLIQYIFAIYLNKNQKFLRNRAILIDIFLVIATIIIPLVLAIFNVTLGITSVVIFLILLVVFYYINHNVYKIYLEKEDEKIKKEELEEEIEEEKKIKRNNLIFYWIALLIIAWLLYFVGELLSNSLTNLCNMFGLPELVLGILLGFITSIPELITFIEAQRKEKKKNTEMANKIGVIEATNNLLTSNLLNLFVIQSIGTIIYTIIR